MTNRALIFIAASWAWGSLFGCGGVDSESDTAEGAVSQTPTERREDAQAAAKRAEQDRKQAAVATARQRRADLAAFLTKLPDADVKPEPSCSAVAQMMHRELSTLLNALEHTNAYDSESMACGVFQYQNEEHVMVSVSLKATPKTLDVIVVNNARDALSLTGTRIQGQSSPAFTWDEDICLREDRGGRNCRP